MGFPRPEISAAARFVSLSALLALSGAAGPSPVLDECSQHLEDIRIAYDEIRAVGDEDWESIFPMIVGARTCLSGTHSAESAKLYDYETNALLGTRQHQAAEAAFVRFFEEEAPHAAPDVMARMHQRFGLLYSRIGRPVEALEEYVASARYAHELIPFEGAELLDRIGNQFRRFGDLDAALPYYASADSLIEAHMDEDPDLIAVRGRIMKDRAAVFMEAADRGQIAEDVASRQAVPLLEEALRIIPPDDSNFDYERVQTFLWLADVYRRQGNPELSLSLSAQALDVSLPVLQREPGWSSWAYSERGNAHLALGDMERARTALETALDIDRKSGRRHNEMLSLVDLGLLEEAVSETSAIPDYSKAEARYRSAIVLAELDRESYGSLEWSASVFEKTQGPYRHLIKLLLRQERFEEAFLTLDNTRARYLQDLRLANQLRPSLHEQDRFLLDSLDGIQYNVRYELNVSGISPTRHSELQAEALSVQGDIDQLLGFTPVPAPAMTLGAIQEALERRGQVLLSYFIGKETTHAFVIRPDTLTAVPLPVSSDSLLHMVAELAEAWQGTVSPDPYVDPNWLVDLYAVLIQPVEAFLTTGTSLVIIPEGSLTGLPFAALAAEAGEQSDYATIEYFGRDHPISMELAAALIAEQPLPREEEPTEDLLAFGRSEFSEQPADLASRGAARLPDLPDVPNELRQIRRLFPSGQFSLNEEASESALYRRMGTGRVIHLASHAIINPTFPLYSYISLWSDADNDGNLFLYELQNRPLNSDLVVLSGCSTAQGERHLGEGMIGLQHAFRAAGAGSTLATMWQVEDQAMTDLMVRFYTHLQAGHRKDRALQLAQLDYLDDNSGMRASPFFWASATLYGDPSPINWQHTYIATRTWIVLGIILLLMGMAFPNLLRRRASKLASA